MKRSFLLTYCLLIGQLSALEYEMQYENPNISVSKVLIMPQEEIGLHRDEHEQVVIGLQGGTITRIEQDGTFVDVDFPTGKAVIRKIDPPEVLHKSVNNGSSPVELIIIQLKDE